MAALLENVRKSAADKYPDTDAVDVGCENVHSPDDDAIVIPDDPDVANVEPFQIVTAPVPPDTTMPVPAVVDDTKLLPREFCLPANIPKSAAERNPACVADDVAIVKVHSPDDEEMVRPVSPDVANVEPFQRVTFPVKAPPPWRPVPAITCVELEKK